MYKRQVFAWTICNQDIRRINPASPALRIMKMIHRRCAGTLVRATTLERLPVAELRRWDGLAISNRDEYAA